MATKKTKKTKKSAKTPKKSVKKSAKKTTKKSTSKKRKLVTRTAKLRETSLPTDNYGDPEPGFFANQPADYGDFTDGGIDDVVGIATPLDGFD
jgi:hypothetical protein